MLSKNLNRPRNGRLRHNMPNIDSKGCLIALFGFLIILGGIFLIGYIFDLK